MRRLILGFLVLLLAAASFGQATDGRYLVHVAYIVPADRTPTADYVGKVGRVMGYVQRFFADQMEAQGFGRMTFRLATDDRGEAAVRLLRSPLTALAFAGEGHTTYRGGTYTANALDTLRQNGITPYRRGEIWVIFMEAQDQRPDGSIRNGTSQGSSGFETGVCYLSSTVLSLSTAENLHDPRPYNGLVLPAVGPIPLVANKSFAYYEGDRVNSLAGVFLGALAHEMGHCFLLQHTYLNDDGLNGTLMGNGFRGWRGYVDPAQWPNEDTRLSRPSALILRLSPYFNPVDRPLVAKDPPQVQIVTPPGDIRLVGGKLRFAFSATATTGPAIALATLQNGVGRDGVGVVAWQEFSGHARHVEGVMETSRIAPGREDRWVLHVYDAAGNVAESLINLKAPANGFAPQPFIRVSHHRVGVGVPITFTADAAVPASYEYHWTFGDGTSATGKTVTHTFTKVGTAEVRLTETDPNGLSDTTSQFMSIRPTPPS